MGETRFQVLYAGSSATAITQAFKGLHSRGGTLAGAKASLPKLMTELPVT